MATLRASLGLLFMVILVQAHPMGNFSVNHYARLRLHDEKLLITYVLDLAEIPTFELLGRWKVDPANDAEMLERSRLQAVEWVGKLTVQNNGSAAHLQLRRVSPHVMEGAGGMPVLRISMIAEADVGPGEIRYEDCNYPGRAGWKEIVVEHDTSVILRSATHGSLDLSGELSSYPADPSVVPPQDLVARAVWSPAKLPIASPPARNAVKTLLSDRSADLAPNLTPAASHATPAPSGRSFSFQQPAAPGTVVRGDFLSRLIRHRTITWGMVLVGIAAAFGLGAMHAMSPGHGKTIVAAYLVGSRGTWRHAAFLGFAVTFTHTLSVFLLGLGVLFFQRYVVPEKIVPVLGALSGVSIVGLGFVLLYQRTKALMDGGHHHHDHAHHHDGHDHTRAHSHDHHAHSHEHEHHSGHVHSHGGHSHSHAPEGAVTLGGLVALGVSGGLVPCPSALILMLSAIALGHPGLGLVLLAGFSAGLALVLLAVGLAVLYAKQLLPLGKASAGRPAFRLIPVFSAVVVICMGLVMTALSTGWFRPIRFLA